MRLTSLMLGAAVAVLTTAGSVSAQQQNPVRSWGFGGLAPKPYTAPTAPRKSNQGGTANKPRHASFSPLTKEECTGLGGSVEVNVMKCGSLVECVTVDRHGVVRSVCINK